jgi:hypothetical protein
MTAAFLSVFAVNSSWGNSLFLLEEALSTASLIAALYSLTVRQAQKTCRRCNPIKNVTLHRYTLEWKCLYKEEIHKDIHESLDVLLVLQGAALEKKPSCAHLSACRDCTVVRQVPKYFLPHAAQYCHSAGTMQMPMLALLWCHCRFRSHVGLLPGANCSTMEQPVHSRAFPPLRDDLLTSREFNELQASNTLVPAADTWFNNLAHCFMWSSNKTEIRFDQWVALAVTHR